MQIAILIFDGLTALDAIGPYEVLSRLPGAELRFVAKQPGSKRTDSGSLRFLAVGCAFVALRVSPASSAGLE